MFDHHVQFYESTQLKKVLIRHIICFLSVALMLSSLSFVVPSIEASRNLTLIDQFGRQVILPERPQRIVSTVPSNTEILFAIGAGDQIVGVTKWCNYPAAAKEKENIGDIVPLNVEKVVSLHPDLVVAHEMNDKEAIDKLVGMGIPVLVMRPTSFDTVLEAISLLGRATGHEQQATRLAQALEARLEAVKEKAKAIRSRGLKVFVMLGGEPVWTAGPGSFIDEAINLAGGQNIASDAEKSWVQFSTELIIRRDPDVIITGENPNQVYSSKTWRTLAAVREKQVYYIDADIFQRPGPRLFDALEQLSALLSKSQ